MASDGEIVVSVEEARNKRAGDTVTIGDIIKEKQSGAIKCIAGLGV